MARIPEKECTIVVPAYNEEERISYFLKMLDGFIGPVIFVCDGTDKTADIVRVFSRENPGYDIECLEYDSRLGKGGGIAEGFKNSKTTYVGFLDADGAASVEEMRKLFFALEDFDCTIGSRWMGDSEIIKSQGLFRRLESRVFNIAIKTLFGLPFRDTQCGAKAFRKEALDTVMPQMKSSGFEFDVEILWRIRNAGYRITEIPIRWENREASHVGGLDGAGMLTNLLRIRRGKL